MASPFFLLEACWWRNGWEECVSTARNRVVGEMKRQFCCCNAYSGGSVRCSGSSAAAKRIPVYRCACSGSSAAAMRIPADRCAVAAVLPLQRVFRRIGAL